MSFMAIRWLSACRHQLALPRQSFLPGIRKRVGHFHSSLCHGRTITYTGLRCAERPFCTSEDGKRQETGIKDRPKIEEARRSRRIRSTTSKKRPFETATGRREYFYYVSKEGNLYVIQPEDKKMPWGPAHLRDPIFLNFFFERLKKNDTGHYTSTFPYLSICQGEYNFVRVAETPVVFHALETVERVQEIVDSTPRKVGARAVQMGAAALEALQQYKKSDYVLVYGAWLVTPFCPSRLRISESFFLYYPHPTLGLCLLKMSVAESLCSEGLKEMKEEEGVQGKSAECKYTLRWQGADVKVKSLMSEETPPKMKGNVTGTS